MKSPLLPADKLGSEDISVHAISRWRLVVTACLALIALSAMAWGRLPRLEDPKVERAIARVTIVYPGASPEDVEAQVIKVVEEDLYSLYGIENMDSTAVPNAALFAMYFADDTNMDVMVEQIRGKIQARKKDMPAEVKDPEVVQMTTAIVPQMIVAVTGNRSDDVLTDAAKRLKNQIATVTGVSDMTLHGDRKRAIRVQLDPVRLEHHGLTPQQVVRQLQLANVRIPGGDLQVGPLSTLLQVNQEFTDASSVMKVPVGASSDGKAGTRVVSLGDVAEVKDDALSLKERFMVNGRPAVAIEIRFRGDENAIKVGQQVRQRISEVSNDIPKGTKIEILHDQPSFIAESVGNFIESLAEGIGLVLLIITLGMGLRAALVVSGVLPLAAGGALFGLYSMGYSIDQISIAGLIVALGLLVDDAVVVTESIQIMRDRGLSATRAAVFGTARVFWANNATTAVACASFVPLFFMGGGTGLFIRELPIAVVLCLTTSLAVAQLFTPWISTLLIRRPSHTRPVPDTEPFDRSHDTGGEHDETNVLLRYLKGLYGRRIVWVVQNPVKVIVFATGCLVGSLALLPKIGFQFFPKAERPVCFVQVELPRGSREEVNLQKLVEAVNIIHAHPEVERSSAVMGAGYPKIFTVRVPPPSNPDLNDVYVELKPGSNVEVFAMQLRKELATIAGVHTAVEELYKGPVGAHPVDVRIFGDDYLKLQAYAEELKAKIQEQKGTINIRDSLTETIPITKVTLDADKAQRVGLTPGQVGGTLRWLYGEDKVTEFRNGDELIQVVLEPRPAPDSPLDSVGEIPVANTKGSTAPLRQAGTAAISRGFAQLLRHNTRRVVEVTGDVEANVLPADVVRKIDPWLRTKAWEPGYGFTYAGTQEETTKSFKNLGIAGIGAMLLIVLLLVVIFDSFTLSLVVMTAVPYAMIGTVAGLGLTGNPFGFMSFLGLIALIGVYVNHKIYFVDRMQELLRRGHDLTSAIVQAGQDRLRPVVLTALTAVLGLLPLTLGGGRLWAGFGWVNIFGLLASIALSLILLPAFISVAFRMRASLKQLRTRSRSASMAPTPAINPARIEMPSKFN